MKRNRKRVVVLGGGLGGLSAAYALTAPEQKNRFEVSVYTMGWRLGGKGASGRNAQIHDRIEEHGLHIWFGCYDNAFQMMKNLYAELDRPPEAPLASLESAFRPQNCFVLNEHVGDEWRPWRIDFPSNDLEPGGHPSTWDFLSILMGWIKRALDGVGVQAGGGAALLIEQVIRAMSKEYEHAKALSALRDAPGHHLGDWLRSLAGQVENAVYAAVKDSRVWAHTMAASLGLLAELVWWELEDRIPQDDDARRTWIASYLGITIMRGILTDDLVHNGVDHINAEDGRAWLRRHASLADNLPKNPNQLAFDSPLIRALYDAAFAYEDGEASRPNFSAATVLRACLWLPFSYKGGFSFEMQAGMGDTVFTPLYLVLLARGVKFHFFSQVADVQADRYGANVEQIVIDAQVSLKQGRYDPLVKVRGLLCWPSQPLYEQLEEGDLLRQTGANLEHYASDWVNPGKRTTLRAGKDFEHVVFAIPLPAHTSVCPTLVAQCWQWKAAVDNVKSTRTQAVQLWFEPTRQQLGVATPPAISGSYIEPWSSLADFSHLLLRERWSNDRVNYLVYTCGAMPTLSGTTQAEADERVFDSMAAFLANDSAPLWPLANDGQKFAWNTLWAEDDAADSSRLRAQYWRANIDINELYILSTSTGIGYRPVTGAAGLKNLSFAGDWTNNGFNISSVEGAVMSGLQASRAISGYPTDIIGEDPKSLTPSD